MLASHHFDYLVSLPDCSYKTGEDTAPYCIPERGSEKGKTTLVLFPASTEAVSAIVAYCYHHRIKLVPQGGLTGLSGASIPTAEGDEIVINISRMNRLLSMTEDYASAEAGMVLSVFKEQVAAYGRYFPLSYSSEQSAQLGGAVATNAGGINFLHYGGARQLLLQCEVVLADGTVEILGNTVPKDNSGYDLKNILVGSEGTLGIITTVTFRVFDPPVQQLTALAGLKDIDKLRRCFRQLSTMMGGSFAAFEVMDARAFTLGRQSYEQAHGTLALFDKEFPYYLLLECATASPVMNLNEMFLAAIGNPGSFLDLDAVILADSLDKAQALWGCRHRISEAAKHFPGMTFDISVADMPLFLRQLKDSLQKLDQSLEVMVFGHAGDYNIHTYIKRFDTNKAFTEIDKQAVEAVVLGLLMALRKQGIGVSISAEHGIGRHKKALLQAWDTPSQLQAMRKIKSCFDPHGIFHPGVIFDME